jgi:hypothetical protein
MGENKLLIFRNGIMNKFNMIKPIVNICPHCVENLAHTSTNLAHYWIRLCEEYAGNNGHLVLKENYDSSYFLPILENLNYIITTDVLAKEDSREVAIKMYGYSHNTHFVKDFCLIPDMHS